MNKYLLSVRSAIIAMCLLFTTLTTQAQLTYNNTWVDYNKTYVKLKVKSEAIHRVYTNVLEDNGVPSNFDNLQLWYEGQEVPLYTNSDDEILGGGEYIEFFGQKNDGKFDSQMYHPYSGIYLDVDRQLCEYYNLFNDTSTYYLTWNETGNNARFEEIITDVVSPPPAEEYFMYESRKIHKNTFAAGHPFRNLGGVNNYFADYGIGEGFASQVLFEGQDFNSSVKTKSVFNTGGNATVRCKVLGHSDDFSNIPDHHVQIKVNDDLYIDETFEGYLNYEYEWEVPLDNLDQDFTTLNVKSMADISNVDKLGVVYSTVTYPHSFDFENAKAFKFTLGNDEVKYFTITNFNGGSKPILYDLTNRLRITPYENEDGGLAFLLAPGENVNETRTFFLFNSTDGIINKNITEAEAINFTDFSDPANQGSFIILTHPFLQQADENGIDHPQRYADYRASAAGGGHEVALVNVEELYDQFAWGIRKHPLGIKNFINYAVDNWEYDPQFLLLLGKAVVYSKITLNPFQFEDCLVPSWGHNASDNQLVVRGVESYTPQLAVGRIPAQTNDDVRIYLDKIIEYEAFLPCTKEDRAWRKDALHVAGGDNIDQADQFLGHLNGYKTIFESPAMGGRVKRTYQKSGGSTIEIANLDSLFNEGIGVVAFVGHSNGEIWDVALKSPEEYTNYGRYPLLISSSCNVGNVHEVTSAPSMAEDFIFAENLGAIGFMGMAVWGYPTYMDSYLQELYNGFCIENYAEPFGSTIVKTIDYFEDGGAASLTLEEGMKLTCQEYTFTGDPSIIVASFDNAEYILENTDVYFTPSELTANLDSFAVNAVVYNMGKAVSDSITVNIERTLPDNTIVNKSVRVPSPIYADTITVYLPIGGTAGDVSGDNLFRVQIDSDNQVVEDCEDNNVVNKIGFVFSDLLIPIAPCDFSIVSQSVVTLAASTGQPLLGNLPYKLEIDTTERFINPIAERVVNSEAGIIEWDVTENMQLENGQVYYWRATQLSPDDEAFNWQGSSFIYEENAAEGWNQSDYYQFAHNDFQKMFLDSLNQSFEFTGVENTIEVNNRLDTDGFNLTQDYAAIRVTLNFTNQLIFSSCLQFQLRGGITMVVFEPAPILQPWTDTLTNGITTGLQGRGSYGNVLCGSGLESGISKPGFEYSTNFDEEMVGDMVDFMHNVIPDGAYVLAYSVMEHKLGTATPDDFIYNYREDIYDFFDELGAEEIRDITDDTPFIVFGRKGESLYDGEVILGNLEQQTFSLNVNVEGSDGFGDFVTPPIGPVRSWDKLYWNYDAVEPDLEENPDSLSVDVFGIDASGTATKLFNSGNTFEVDLSSIDAAQYPYIRLKAVANDFTFYSAPQLEYWRVTNEMCAELALNLQEHFEVVQDTVQEGEPIQVEFALSNQSSANLDSVLVQFTVIDENNQSQVLNYPRQAPMTAGETIIASLDYPTTGMEGYNSLLIEVNPNDDQCEKFRFNNVMMTNFYVTKDKINPILDVTFDGRHILDGDLVSAQPMITIAAKDENKFLALNDTSDFDLILKYPDANGTPSVEKGIYFSNPAVTFIPATADDAAEGDNRATVEFAPTLEQDGTYELVVRTKDRTSNFFDGEDLYSVQFQVINQSMVSNVLNYPNPFTTSTKFIFTLTGSEIPDFFKIQIMTVSGKVVREITRGELGNIHIGENITDYAWDGTDTYGNKLANGLYLYRVVTRLNGETLDQYQLTNEVDNLFAEGLGKMYLMR